LELCEDEHDSVVLIRRSPSFFHEICFISEIYLLVEVDRSKMFMLCVLL